MRAEMERLLKLVDPKSLAAYIGRERADQLAPYLHRLRDDLDFDARLGAANERYLVSAQSTAGKTAADVLGRQPTPEQAEAIATDEDVTLVLAGAGTGKTSVITGKAAHLVHDRGVAPEEILVLAFNNKAAQEIRERLPGALGAINVRTFHAFGLEVLTDVLGRRPSLSKLSENNAAQEAAIGQIILSQLMGTDPEDVLIRSAAYDSSEYRSPFEFHSSGEYYTYLRSIEPLPLGAPSRAPLAKSYEELEIANFLALNGIPYRRLYPYSTSPASRREHNYSALFYLPKHALYIEHFALDVLGRPPQWWSQYRERVDWIRDIHERNGTHLIETYSWWRGKGN